MMSASNLTSCYYNSTNPSIWWESPDTTVSIMLAVFLTVLYLTSVSLNFGYMWYSKYLSNTHSTLMAELFSTVARNNLVYDTFFLLPIIARFFLKDGLNSHFCLLALLIRRCCGVVWSVFLYNEILVLRCIHICRTDSVLFRDRVFRTLFSWINIVCGVFFTFVITIHSGLHYRPFDRYLMNQPLGKLEMQFFNGLIAHKFQCK